MTTIKKLVYGIICFILLTILAVTAKNGITQTTLEKDYLGNESIPILMYHHVVGGGEEVNKITLTKERLQEDLKYLSS